MLSKHMQALCVCVSVPAMHRAVYNKYRRARTRGLGCKMLSLENGPFIRDRYRYLVLLAEIIHFISQ